MAVAREDAAESLRTTQGGEEPGREEREACWVPRQVPYYPSGKGGG